MKKVLFILVSILPFLTFAAEKGLDQKIDECFGWATSWFVQVIFYQIPFTDNINIYWVLFPLIIGAVYFTLYFRFINFKGFFTSIRIVRGKYDNIESKGENRDDESDNHIDPAAKIPSDNAHRGTDHTRNQHDGQTDQ